MLNTELFSNKSVDYSQFRPAYSPAAIEWLRSNVSGDSVLDVGAGTGIFTKMLLRAFKTVSAVEPNDDMRKCFQENLPELLCQDTTAEATGLPDDSVDLITVAQAFHWLDAEEFKREALRILHPGGSVAIVWNNSLKNDFTDARNRICQRYCPRFRSGHAGKRSVSEGDKFLRESYFRQVKVVEFNNPFAMDLRTFEGNTRSRSYALAPCDGKYVEFMQELRTLFEMHAQDGIVIEPQITQIYLGCF